MYQIGFIVLDLSFCRVYPYFLLCLYVYFVQRFHNNHNNYIDLYNIKYLSIVVSLHFVVFSLLFVTFSAYYEQKLSRLCWRSMQAYDNPRSLYGIAAYG